MTQRNVLFTGSIGLENEDQVFQTLAEKVGGRAKRYPDGETGARYHWVRWLDGTYKANPQFQVHDPDKKVAGYKDSHTRAFYVLADGVAPDEVDIGRFGYAEYAIASHRKFQALKKDGAIPPATRFQVSLPTAVAATSAFIEIDARADVEPAAEYALMGEVTDLVHRI